MMNQLTISKGKALACLILLCLFLGQGCKKDILQPNSPLLKNSLSIAEAKAYFDANLMKDNKPEKLMSTEGRNDVTYEDILNQKQAIWESAYEQLISTGGAVKVPLDFGKVYAVVNKRTNALVPLSTLNYLLMYKDSLQNIHAEWVSLNPDSNWLYGNRNQYTGTIRVSDWHGKTIKNLSYGAMGSKINVSLKNKLLLSTSPSSDPGLENVVCISIQREGGAACTCADKSNCDMCNVCAKTICSFPPPECALCNDPGNPGGNGGGGNGGGLGSGGSGGGGSSNGNYPPSCNPDPNYVVPSIPPPLGTEWILPCSGPGSVPIPVTPIPTSSILSNIVNWMGITDVDKQNFLLTHNEIYLALSDYLVANGTATETKEFVDWAVGYLMENPNTPLDKINVALVKSPNIRISFADRINYPILAKIIDGLHAKVKNDPKLMAAIKKFSQMNETQILEKLISGKGPNLVLKDMPLNEYGEEIGDGNIYINKVYATGFYNIQVLPPQSLEFFLTSCILHEFVHFGNTVVMDRFPSKRDSGGYFWDAGKQFEEDYYGGDIGYDISTGKIIFTKYQ